MMFQPHAEYHFNNPMCFGGTLLSDLPARDEPAPVVGGRFVTQEMDDEKAVSCKRLGTIGGAKCAEKKAIVREALYSAMEGKGILTAEQVTDLVQKKRQLVLRALKRLGASGHVKVVIYTRKNVTYEWVAV